MDNATGTPEDTVPFVLASSSPRRRLLLSLAGFEFGIAEPAVDESRFASEPAEDYVIRTALAKAHTVAQEVPPGTLVLGCDTTVVLDGAVLGKPADENEAETMLLSLAGKTHVVYTGYALVAAGSDHEETGIDAARVTMRPVTPQEAATYAATGEPLDKAGGYALQGRGGGFVEEVDGLRSTVIGLPLERIIDLLIRNGVVPTRAGGEDH
jgi:septum formation protein